MSTPHPDVHLTPEQARDRLAVTAIGPLTTMRDRRVHAAGAAVVGLTMGLHMAMRNVVTEGRYALLSAAFVGVLVAEVLWVERASRTTPRRGRRWFWTGFTASFVLVLAVVTPWLNLGARTRPNTWAEITLGAAVIALPSLLAAAAIARPRRR